MWKTNGTRQRLILALIGIVLIGAGGLIGWMNWRDLSEGRASADGLLRDVLPVTMPDLAMYASLILALIALVSLTIVISVLPQKPANRTFIYRSASQSGISRIDTRVISRAAQDSAHDQSGLLNATIRISGSAEKPVLYARFTLRVDSSPLTGMNFIRDTLVPDMETALGTGFSAKHIMVDFGSKKSELNTRVTLT